MISVLYFFTFITSLLTFTYDQPSFQSRLPETLWKHIDSYTNSLSPTFIKNKLKIYAFFSITILLQILSHIRIPKSKGDLLAIIFELATYGLAFIFTLYLLRDPLNENLSNSSLTFAQNINKWINVAYLWTEFRVHDVLFWATILYLANITLSAL